MMRMSADARQVQLAAPARQQRLAHPAVRRAPQLRVLGDDRLRLAPRLLEDGGIAQQVRHAELGQSRLARAEELARTAQLQIGLGDLEAVVRTGHRVDPPPGLLAQAAGREQDAVRLPLAAADAPAQLVELREAEALRVLDQ